MASYFRNREYLNLILGQILYFISHNFAWVLFPLFILSVGFEPIDLAWFFAMMWFTAIVALLLVSKNETKWVLQRGLLLRGVMIFILIFLSYEWQLWLLAVIYGVFVSLFWVTYNIRYYSLTTKGGTAFASAVMTSIGPLVGIIIPTITGFIAGSLGLVVSVLFALPFLAGAIMAFRKLPAMKVEYDISKAVRSVRRLRTLLFIDGFWQTSYYVLIPIITLDYVFSELSYGAFISYVGVVGVIASFVLSKLADKYNNRSIFIYPTTMLLATFTFLAAFTDKFWSWTIIVGLFSFFRAMASPLMMTVVVDAKGNLVDSMLGREFMLMVGRFSSTVLVLLTYYSTKNLSIALIILGAVTAFYPLILFKTRLYHDVDKRMRFAAKNRFEVMLRVWFLSPLMFFPKNIRSKWPTVKKFWQELKINAILKR